ncbi:hypothetical protein [Hyphomonas pacifica]|nr:hypothetical protein [Hyphomonas pacifica]
MNRSTRNARTSLNCDGLCHVVRLVQMSNHHDSDETDQQLQK